MRRSTKHASQEFNKNAHAKTNRTRKRRRRRTLILLCVAAALTTACGIGYFRFYRKSGKPTPAIVAPVANSDPPGIILHASDSPASYHGVVINAAALERIHAHDHPEWATEYEGKLYHIGYHYVILPNGEVERGRPDHCKGCHAPHFNDCIGICMIGCFDPSIKYQGWPTVPTNAQVKAITKLCEELMTKYRIPVENVLRHYDTKRTWCPGRRYPFKKIKKDLTEFTLAHPEIRPTKFVSLETLVFKRD